MLDMKYSFMYLGFTYTGYKNSLFSLLLRVVFKFTSLKIFLKYCADKIRLYVGNRNVRIGIGHVAKRNKRDTCMK